MTSMKLKRFIRRKFRHLAFRPDYVRRKSLPSFNKKAVLLSQHGFFNYLSYETPAVADSVCLGRAL